MRDNYDFTNGVKNPYAKRLKSQVTMNLDNDTIEYFKESASETGIPYQKLINLYSETVFRTKENLYWSGKAETDFQVVCQSMNFSTTLAKPSRS